MLLHPEQPLQSPQTDDFLLNILSIMIDATNIIIPATTNSTKDEDVLENINPPIILTMNAPSHARTN